MKFKKLGNTGVRVSERCFGTMSFGGEADEAESLRMFTACRDAGINFFDCANGYVGGESEKILGKLMKSSRDDLVITSKCFVPMGKRLDTDRIDVLFMHRWDTVVPLEETLRALEQLVADGKVIYLGASNYSAWQVAKGLGISERNHWPRFDVLQPMYSLVKRQVESEILPLAEAENLGVISYSPVGGGLLSGKYGRDKKDSDGRLVKNKMYTARYDQDWAYGVAEDFTELAKELGVHPVSLAVAWVGANPAVTCPIIGARHAEQLQPSLDSVNIDMTDELYDRITALSPAPAPATDRLEEAT